VLKRAFDRGTAIRRATGISVRGLHISLGAEVLSNTKREQKHIPSCYDRSCYTSLEVDTSNGNAREGNERKLKTMHDMAALRARHQSILESRYDSSDIMQRRVV
jgi:hypothetical protein